jgi:hypothetical protein
MTTKGNNVEVINTSAFNMAIPIKAIHPIPADTVKGRPRKHRENNQEALSCAVKVFKLATPFNRVALRDFDLIFYFRLGFMNRGLDVPKRPAQNRQSRINNSPISRT